MKHMYDLSKAIKAVCLSLSSYGYDCKSSDYWKRWTNLQDWQMVSNFNYCLKVVSWNACISCHAFVRILLVCAQVFSPSAFQLLCRSCKQPFLLEKCNSLCKGPKFWQQIGGESALVCHVLNVSTLKTCRAAVLLALAQKAWIFSCFCLVKLCFQR